MRRLVLPWVSLTNGIALYLMVSGALSDGVGRRMAAGTLLPRDYIAFLIALWLAAGIFLEARRNPSARAVNVGCFAAMGAWALGILIGGEAGWWRTEGGHLWFFLFWGIPSLVVAGGTLLLYAWARRYEREVS